MESARSKLFISTQELSDLLDDKQEPQIVNATWYMPNEKRDAFEEHLTCRISTNTVFFDHDMICDTTNPSPHALPSLEQWIHHMKRLNVQSHLPIVCYDAQGMFSVARAAWMFRYFGGNVRILDGGFKAWSAESRGMTSRLYDQSGDQLRNGEPVTEGTFDYHIKNPLKVITDIGDMHKVAADLYHQKDGAIQVVDARSEQRFTGAVFEPRPGVRSGNIKNSLNVPFNLLVDSETGKMRSDEEIAAVFEKQGVDMSKPLINTCGSGVTACVLELGQNILGKTDSVVYDGSWSEYGSIDEPDFEKK